MLNELMSKAGMAGGSGSVGFTSGGESLWRLDCPARNHHECALRDGLGLHYTNGKNYLQSVEMSVDLFIYIDAGKGQASRPSPSSIPCLMRSTPCLLPASQRPEESSPLSR